MANLKVLKHTTYLPCKYGDKRLLSELDNYHEEIEPVFNRDGEYMLGDNCWFEVRGRAFKHDIKTFKFDMAQLNCSEIDVQVINLLRKLYNISPKSLSSDQIEIINNYDHYLEVKKKLLLSKKRVIKMRERFRDKISCLNQR